MSVESKDKKEINVSIFDFIAIIRKYRFKIAFIALIFASLGIAYGSIKPLRFVAEALFREEGQTQSDGRMANLSLTSFTSSDQNKAISFFKSRFLIERVIKELNLQVSLITKSPKEALLETVANNLKIELSSLISKIKPQFKEDSKAVDVREVIFSLEKSLKLKFSPLGGNAYELKNEEENETYAGHFGKPLFSKDFSFTLDLLDESELPNLKFILLTPTHVLVKQFSTLLEAKPDLKDKKLVNLSFTYPLRKTAVLFLDTLMDAYIKYQQEKSDKLSKSQLQYLKKRQQEESLSLKEVLDSYARELESHVSLSGFPKGEDAMRFLVTKQFDLKQKDYALLLEINRLKELSEGDLAYYDPYNSHGDSQIINTLLGEMRHLKMKSDEALQSINKNKQTEISSLELANHIKNLDKIRNTIAGLQKIKDSFKEDRHLTPFSDEFFESIESTQILNWYKQLLSLKKESKNQNNLNSFLPLRDKFISYLSNLIQFHTVQEKTVEERIIYQTNESKEFNGLTLSMAENLLEILHEDLKETQSDLQQQLFISDCVSNEETELGPLISMTNDIVSSDMLSRYNRLLLDLKDESNRSHKEQERIKQELDFTRNCFEKHLSQIVSWLSLKTELLKDKILNLKETVFVLYQQSILLLEKQLRDYTESRIHNLEKEKELISEHLKSIQKEMANVPKTWVADILVQYQVDSAKLFGRQISQMVESKNIAMNLELTKSHPVDLAFAANTPKPPALFIYGLIGLLLGGSLSLISFVCYEGFMGLRLSMKNLQGAHKKVAGPFKLKDALNTLELSDENLLALRQVLSFAEIETPKKTLLLSMGNYVDYSESLAKLLKKIGKKILVMDLSFSQASNEDGLYAYLLGESQKAPILNKDGYHFIPSNGITRYSNELLLSNRFKELLLRLAPNYDVILGVSTGLSSEVDLKNLIHLFGKAVISIHNERVQDFEEILSIEDNEALTLFLFVE